MFVVVVRCDMLFLYVFVTVVVYLMNNLSCFGSFFFFKQKTAYEMRISDWSSDVCSSDLVPGSKVMLCRREGGKILNCLSMPAMTPAEWRARITSQDRKSAAPFDQRCQVRFAKFLSEGQ